jgi:uncharacterized protein
MTTLIITFVIFATVMAIMAIGVILQGKSIKGSCGGIAALGMGRACDICGGDTQKCEKETEKRKSADTSLAYDASKQ